MLGINEWLAPVFLSQVLQSYEYEMFLKQVMIRWLTPMKDM